MDRWHRWPGSGTDDEAWDHYLSIALDRCAPSWQAILPKARRLIEAGAITRLAPSLWLVRGDTRRYRVESAHRPITCTCPHGMFRPSSPCSHRVAIELILRCLAGGATWPPPWPGLW